MTTSSNDPDQIRADIERTRAELSDDVDALTEKVSPSRVAERQTQKVKDAVGGVKDKVFGVADDARDTFSDKAGSVREGAGSVKESAMEAPHQVKRRAEGNPLAAGLVAFGVGLFASSLIPSTRKEREVVAQAKESDALQGVAEGAKGMGQEMAEHLREPAREAAEQLKATTTEGAQQVKDTAASGAEDVKAEARGAADDVKGEAQASKERVQGSGTDYPPTTGTGYPPSTGTGY